MDTDEGYKIEVRGARGLMPMDPNGQSDPYCLIGVADPTTNAFMDPSSVARSKVCLFVVVIIYVEFSIFTTLLLLQHTYSFIHF
jgi:hypothetical protein